MIAFCDENDKLDPNYGPAESWPWWTDLDCYALGPPYFVLPPAAGPDPTPDQIPGEEQPLEGPDPDQADDDDTGDFPDPDRMGEAERELSHDFEPDPEDVADWLERLHFEEGCNARFAPDCRVG